MMDFVKRHLFLIGLGAGVFVVGAILLLGTQLMYRGPNVDMEQQLSSAGRRARDLTRGPLYNQAVVDELKTAVDQRRTRYEETLKYLAKRGHDRKVMVEDVFPMTTNTGLLHNCKAAYRASLEQLMKTLGAASPATATATEAEKEVKRAEIAKSQMLVNPKFAFSYPDWVDKAEAPNLDLVRYAQEDLWLMEDLVSVVAQTNEANFPAEAEKRVIANAAVKELLEIRIGGEAATIEGSKGAGRYRPAAANGETRQPTLTGRPSRPGFCLVLPWRMVVLADAEKFGDLLRRLRDHETFLTVDGIQVEPVTEATFSQAKSSAGAEIDQYGTGALVRLTVTGESLVFQLPDGRVTTPPEVLQEAARQAEAEAAQKKAAEEKASGGKKSGGKKTPPKKTTSKKASEK